jgi:SAM-dependent methyltransferase
VTPLREMQRGSYDPAVAEGATNAVVVTRLYTPIAPDYEEIWAPLLRPYGVRLLERLAIENARRVLEIGCGVGRLLPDVGERAPSAVVVGTDLVEGMLRRAPRRFPLVVMDGSRPSFAQGAFDAAVLSFMLFHLPDPRGMLEAVRSVLRPGGRIGVATWGTGGSFPASDVFTEELDAHGAGPDAGSGGAEEEVDSPDKMEAILASAGFVEPVAEVTPWRQRWEFDAFMEWRTRLGASRRRLDTLEPDVRRSCLRRIRERLATMPSDAFVDRDEVVLSTARVP